MVLERENIFFFTHFFFYHRSSAKFGQTDDLATTHLQRESCPVFLASISFSLYIICLVNPGIFLNTGFKEKENTVIIVILRVGGGIGVQGHTCHVEEMLEQFPHHVEKRNWQTNLKGGGAGSVTAIGRRC